MENTIPSIIDKLSKRKWLISAMLIWLCICSAALFVANDHSRRLLEKNMAMTIKKHAEKIEHEFRHEREHRHAELNFFSQLQLIQALLNPTNYRESDPALNYSVEQQEKMLREVLITYINTHPAIYQIRIISKANNWQEIISLKNESGKILVLEDERQQVSAEDNFDEILRLQQGEVYVSDIRLKPVQDEVAALPTPVSSIVTPVFSPVGERLGMVLIDFDESEFFALLEEGPSPDISIFLNNTAGDLLLHPKEGHTFGWKPGSTYNWEEQFTPQPISPHLQALGLQSYASSVGKVYRGSKVLDMSPNAGNNSLHMTHVFSESSIKSRLHAHLQFHALILGAATLLIAMFAMIFVVYQRRRERLEQRFEIAVESSPNAMIMVNEQGKIVMINNQTLSLFGYDRNEMIGAPLESLVPQRSRSEHPKWRKKYLAAPGIRAMGAGRELFALTKSGKEVPVEIGLSPYNSDEGRIVMATITDISVRKAYEETATKMNRELIESNRALERYAHITSHDLQEPLRGIYGCLQLLEQKYSEHLDAKAQKYIELSRSNAERLHRMINDLLHYSQVSKKPNPPETFKVQDVLDAALQNLSIAIAESEAEIIHDELPEIVGDRTMLPQVFQNVIANSIKFCDENITPQIRISVVPDKDVWRFTVSDNGLGIDPQFSNQVFEVFRRLYSEKQYPGTGMGLATSKRIIEVMGGKIWIDTDAEQGTKIIWTIPRIDD